MRIKNLRGGDSEVRFTKTRLLHLGNVEKPPRPHFLRNGRLRVNNHEFHKFSCKIIIYILKTQVSLMVGFNNKGHPETFFSKIKVQILEITKKKSFKNYGKEVQDNSCMYESSRKSF